MDIGKPERVKIVEPLEDPVPSRESDPGPVRDPDPVPALPELVPA